MNILVLTTIYKDIDDPMDAATTPVVHNFAKEWVKQGHNVIVIHNFNVFPQIFYYVPQVVWDKLSAKKGFRTILNKKQKKDTSYTRDGVKIYRNTVKKPMPLGSYTEKELRRSVEKIEAILKAENFVPDVIAAHMENPQIFQLYMLKSKFPDTITSLVFHKIDYLHKKEFEEWKNKFLPTIDKIGFRSREAYRDACKLIGFDRNDYYFCPSGISKEVVEQNPDYKGKFKDGVLKLIYVGQLIPRKHAETIIEAIYKLKESEGINNILLNIIGTGVEEESLKAKVKEYELDDVVTFSGRKPHKEVLQRMQESDVFIMVSDKEVFGLVYIEAMSQGCIVIASSEGGMEGIIQDGKNGYLSMSGDVEELTKKIKSIMLKTRADNIAMSKNAFNTASEYTDDAVARNYLANIVR